MNCYSKNWLKSLWIGTTDLNMSNIVFILYYQLPPDNGGTGYNGLKKVKEAAKTYVQTVAKVCCR